jgi:hypothetical protein
MTRPPMASSTGSKVSVRACRAKRATRKCPRACQKGLPESALGRVGLLSVPLKNPTHNPHLGLLSACGAFMGFYRYPERTQTIPVHQQQGKTRVRIDRERSCMQLDWMRLGSSMSPREENVQVFGKGARTSSCSGFISEKENKSLGP